jgi:glycerol-3-phosphate O-acyltransferase
MVKRIINSRVADIDEREVLRDAQFQAALKSLAREQQTDYEEAQKYAARCLDELAVRPGDRYLSWIAALARFMYTRSFEPEFDINVEALSNLREMSKNRPLVFLWSHRSHLDGFVLTRTLYDAEFRPQPLIFAGINMNFLGFGALAKHSGAIFLRRSFRDDEVYKLVLRYVIDYLASRRVPLSWSIEGTRSRTGRLLRPKLGLVRWVMDAYRRASIDDALFVPVSISFDQIPEMDDYIAMQHGTPKRKESLKWFIEYIAGMKSRFGKVYVRFAEPLALSESLPASAVPSDPDDRGSEVQKVALEICNRIEHATPITLTDLVTLVLLAANDRALDLDQIWRQAAEIVEIIVRRDLPTAGMLNLRDPEDLDETLNSMIETGLLRQYSQGSMPVYRITPGQQLAAAYYRNTIVHYFLSSAIAEAALAATRFDPSGRSFEEALLRFRDLLKFEFSFKPKEEFVKDAVEYLDNRYPAWRSRSDVLAAGPRPLFGQTILRSFVEAYSILAAQLAGNGSGPLGAGRDELVDNCLALGREMLLRRRISSETALSGPLLETGIRLANHRRLLDARDEGLAGRRESFSAEVARALEAIDRLQQIYDRQLEEPMQDHYLKRSIA